MQRYSLTVWLVILLLSTFPVDAKQAPAYLHLSDIHLDLSGQSSDTDPQLWSITKNKLLSILNGSSPPAFVIYTGDLPGHYKCEKPDCSLNQAQQQAHNANLEKVLSDLHNLVSDRSIPLFYAPGNNDSLAGDFFSFSDKSGQTPLSLVPRLDFPASNAEKPCGSAPCMVSNPDPAMGFYSARPIKGLRVVILNSVVFSSRYVAIGDKSQRQAGDEQLDWLASELAHASGREKVLIATHIPPGNDAYSVSHNKPRTWMWARHPDGEGDQPRDHKAHWLDRFLDLVSDHSETIIGLAYGHTHLDELRRLHDRSGNMIEVAISAPGITTNHGNNPGFKLVSFDATTKELLDFETFYTEKGNAEWGEKSYSFDAQFNCEGADQDTILACLASAKYKSTEAIDKVLDETITVMNGPPSFDTSSGIEVKHGQ